MTSPNTSRTSAPRSSRARARESRSTARRGAPSSPRAGRSPPTSSCTRSWPRRRQWWGGWLGRESFHCGAFVAGGGAWALLGERESGKSSTLAALALAGYGIVCDDILLLEGTACFPGPRCVDLREETAAALDAGDALGTVGGRERWRLPVPQLHEAPVLRGIVFLDWGDDFEAEPVPASRQLAGLLHHRALRLHSSVPEVLLELAALPAWELRRPRRLDSLGGTVDRLADLVSAA